MTADQNQDSCGTGTAPESDSISINQTEFAKPHTSLNGAQIRSQRQACGLSRPALAQRCRVSASTLKLLERGPAVQQSTLASIAAGLDDLLATRARGHAGAV